MSWPKKMKIKKNILQNTTWKKLKTESQEPLQKAGLILNALKA